MEARGSRPGAQRTAALALTLTVLLAAAKLAVWIATSSLAVLSQALDSGVDIVALGLVLVAVRIAARPADATHHYGHAKAENLVAFTQTIVLAAVAIGVGYEAVDRLVTNASPASAPWYAIALLAVSACVDSGRFL